MIRRQFIILEQGIPITTKWAVIYEKGSLQKILVNVIGFLEGFNYLYNIISISNMSLGFYSDVLCLLTDKDKLAINHVVLIIKIDLVIIKI